MKRGTTAIIAPLSRRASRLLESDVQRQVIQEFIGTAPWDHRPLINVLVGQVVERLGEPDGVIAFDPSSFPKRGTHSVGVKRQWCSHRGKIDTCQVWVYMGYVARGEHALLDFRLSLPEDWARDKHRRQACHVPEEVHYHTQQEQCLEMLDLWGKQVTHGWVTGDDELGRHTWFRQQLRARGERYMLGVPCTTAVRDLEASWPAYQGRGRPPKPLWQSVKAWRQALEPEVWTRLTVRDDEKGPVELELVRRRVQTRLERKRTGPQEWLVVTRHPLTDSRMLETQASREACEQDARYGYRYRSIYHTLSRVNTGREADHLLSIAEPIAGKDAHLFEGFSCPWTPPAIFYKLREIERYPHIIRTLGHLTLREASASPE